MTKHIHNIERIQNSCVAFGSFDGVHKGHMAIADKVVKTARSRNLQSVIVSLYSGKATVQDKVLTTEEEKLYYFDKKGLDLLISCNTDDWNISKEILIREVVIAKTKAEVIITGEEHPDLELIKKVAADVGVEVIVEPAVRYQGKPLTSRTIRNAFDECRFDAVTEMCGHPYVMVGTVEHGKALGRTVGMPTANLGVADIKLKPPSGVYATLTDIDGEVYQGLTNIGTRPSVDDMSYITIETFLLDFNRDIYGKHIIMEVHLYIRGVKRFDNLAEVKEQVQKDIEEVKGYLDATTDIAI